MEKPKDNSKDSSRLSRRKLLRAVGLGGTAPSQDMLAPVALTSEPSPAATVGPGAVPVRLKINGRDYRFDVEPRVTLLDAMRDHLGLTGAKRACNHAECGACTVLVDGRPIYACTMLAIAAQGKEIATIEGLAANGQLDPLQAAFVKHDALQCGFCTSGFVLALGGLLLGNPHPSADEVRQAVAGNLCPCGTYPRVLAAVEEAAKASESESRSSRQSLVRSGALEGGKHVVTAARTTTSAGLPGDVKAVEAVRENDELAVWDLDYQPSIVGQEVSKLGAADNTAGRTKYTEDVGLAELPGLLHAKQLWLSYPLKGVESIDIAKAQALPGVKAIIAIQPVPEPSGGPRAAGEDLTSRPREGRRPLPAGEVVAAVAAESEAIAEDVLRLIEVKYAPLPAANANQEMRARAAPAQEGSEGLPARAKSRVRERGNAAQAFQDADLAIYDGTFQVPAAYPVSLEPSACVAAWEGESLSVWATTHEIFALRNDLAKALNISASHLRVIAEHVGGGCDAAAARRCATIAARLAGQAGRPVKLIYDRADEAWLAGHRPVATLRIRIAARKDGTLHAIDFRAWGAASAGASDPIWMIYRCPNVRIEEANGADEDCASPASAAGLRQGTFALEQAMDELACQLRMDPLEFRRKNFAHDPFLPLKKMCHLGAERIGWYERRRGDAAEAATLRRGLGMAVGAWPSTGVSFAQAMVRIYPDGSIEVVTGAQDLGTGTGTALGMIAAEELGVPLEKVKVSLGDTACGLAAPLGSEGRTLSSLGVAVRGAARDAKQKLTARVATVDSKSESTVATRALRPPPWTPEGREMVSAPVVGYGESAQAPAGCDHPAWAVQFVDVSVDMETGLVNVEKVVSLVEAGRVINRLTLEGAVLGGTIRGLSVALSEGRVVDRRIGRTLIPNLWQTRIPGACGLQRIEPVIIDSVSPANSLGVKGLGDLPMVPTAGAVANAIANALGVRLCDLPLTPARIQAACSDAL